MRKVYGQSKVEGCPFCGKQSTTENDQGVPVCRNHKDKCLDFKCICGQWLDVNKGKYGPYFNCMNCGNISYRKGMEMNEEVMKKARGIVEKTIPKKKHTPGEITVTSDDLDFM